jgi:A/G-specific adenine glycosylase
LRALPGIGAYSAAAVAAIAFDVPAAVVDGNIERVIARLFAIETPLPAAKDEIRDHQRQLTPADRPGDYAQAMMDLGAAICTPKGPACSLCPFNADCKAHAGGAEEQYPRRSAKADRPTRYGAAFVAVRSDGAVLLRTRPERGLLGGMSEVPGTDWSSRVSGFEPLVQAPLKGDWEAVVGRVVHVFTHFRLELSVFRTTCASGTPAPAGMWWSPAGALPNEALPSVMRKVIEATLPGATRKRTRRAA